MDISKQCRPGLGKPWISPTGGSGLGYPKLQKLYHGYLLSVQTKYGISQILKICTYGVQTCIWFIHGIVCDNQRYPWYISKHWYIAGISLVYAKTRKLINSYQIPDEMLNHLVPNNSWYHITCYYNRLYRKYCRNSFSCCLLGYL